MALQAIGVAILATIMFLAFLLPSNPSDLIGIDAGDGPNVVSPTGPTGPKGPKNGPGGGNGNGRDGMGNRGSGPGGSGSGQGGTDGSGGFVPPLGDNPDTPTGSQYGDTVARLLDQTSGGDTLSRAAAPGE